VNFRDFYGEHAVFMTVRRVTPWRESGPILKILSNSGLEKIVQRHASNSAIL
jgi:hypothetical protein